MEALKEHFVWAQTETKEKTKRDQNTAGQLLKETGMDKKLIETTINQIMEEANKESIKKVGGN